MMLRIKFRALGMLDKYFTTELNPQPYAINTPQFDHRNPNTIPIMSFRIMTRMTSALPVFVLSFSTKSTSFYMVLIFCVLTHILVFVFYAFLDL